ncbi:hypothetical protein M9H77_16284 [Catharanthus roseus]|uniref:Uncharacterized protein n=1 Tax=Catharanthus roseus TaxID=4058 RepID=A0ACC0B1C7_CATRO|nr:hypothetical protein M9H77_16284 [Catharanthus roseus]
MDSMILKSKRNKRLRPPSPPSTAVPTSCSASSSDRSDEDEDMAANCLILLAQGGCGGNSKQLEQEEEDDEIKDMEKISSAKFFVYECKTCNRTFSSFQALGGHRASHKKPKLPTTAAPPDDHELEEEDGLGQFNILELPNFNKGNNKMSNKIHECSICGSEFSSGQALGGHMRRHRNISTITKSIESSEKLPPPSPPVRSIFPLDLNLPAPAEDDHGGREMKFQFSANKQRLVFSAPALVDCHY